MYADLSQTTHNTECQNGDDCNSRRWEPWRTFPDQVTFGTVGKFVKIFS